MTKTLLFDPFPAHGHVRAMIRLASIFPKSEYSIVFVGYPEFAELVRSNGHEYYVVDSFIITSVAAEIKKMGMLNFAINNIFYSRFKKLDQELINKTMIYDSMMQQQNPDLIFLDDHYSEKTFFYSKYGTPITNVQTMVLPDWDLKVPPFQTRIIPKNTFLSNLKIRLAWNWRLMLRNISRIKGQLLTMRQTNLLFLQKSFKDSGYRVNRHRCFGLGIDQIPTISLTPRSFDFPRNTIKKNLYYLGIYSKADKVQVEDARLKSLLYRYSTKSKIENQSFLIYCSLGTVTDEFLKRGIKFYNVIIKVARQYPNYEFMLSLGEKFDTNQFLKKPSNIHIFKNVPQQSLLSNIDFIITHGGLNTIRECIQEEVPMIVYPLTIKWDQPGNSSRVIYHKLGVRGEIKNMNGKSLKLNIDTMISNRKEFRKSLHSLKEQIENEQQIEINAIQQLVHRLINEKQ